MTNSGTNAGESRPVVIRPRTSADLERIAALAAESAQWHADHWPEDIGAVPSTDSLVAAYAGLPTDDEAIYFRVAELDQMIVGFLLATLSPPPTGGMERYPGSIVAVADIAVTAAARRSGIAAALMEDVADWAHTLGAETLTLQMHADNGPAQALYEREGFRVSHVRMRKDL